MRTKTPDTYYINNDYTNATTEVYEEYIKFRTGSNHKKRRKTKKLVFQKNKQKIQPCINQY